MLLNPVLGCSSLVSQAELLFDVHVLVFFVGQCKFQPLNLGLCHLFISFKVIFHKISMLLLMHLFVVLLSILILISFFINPENINLLNPRLLSILIAITFDRPEHVFVSTSFQRIFILRFLLLYFYFSFFLFFINALFTFRFFLRILHRSSCIRFLRGC